MAIELQGDDPTAFLTTRSSTLAAAGVFGILSLLVTEGWLLTDSPPVLRRGVLVASLLLCLLPTAVIVSTATSHLLEEGSHPVFDLWFLLVAVAGITFGSVVTFATLGDNLLVELLSFVLFSAILSGYLHLYPTDRYRRTRTGHAPTVVAGALAALVVISLFDGFAGIVPSWDSQVVRVGVTSLAAVFLHLAFSEGVQGLLDLRRTVRRARRDRTAHVSVATGVALAEFGVLLVSAAITREAWRTGFAEPLIRTLQWDSAILVHWLVLSAWVAIVIAIDRGFMDEFVWGGRGSRSDPLVERSVGAAGMVVLALAVGEVAFLAGLA